MKLESKAFENSNDIPAQYTCDGQDTSPALSWDDAPEGTQAYALVAEDPDAPSGTWTHWLVYNIPADMKSLPHGLPPEETLDHGILQDKNDFGKIGYGGPCPPKGHGKHRYYFRLFALDGSLPLAPGTEKQGFMDALQGRTLAESRLEGRFGR